MADFQYTNINYVNTTTPAINATNLNKNDSMVDKLAFEANLSASWRLKDRLQYGLNRNMKMIDSMAGDLSDWTVDGTLTASKDTSEPFNANAVKLTETDNSSGIIRLYKTITSIDLTTFNDGRSSPTSDFICFPYYLSDSTLVYDATIRLGTSPGDYYWVRLAVEVTGRNIAIIPKSSFNEVGSPTGWDAITYIAIYCFTNANASGEYVSFSNIFMGNADSGNFINPLEGFDGAGGRFEYWMYGDTSSYIYYDEKINKLGMQMLYKNKTPTMNEIQCTRNCFSFKCESYSKYAGYGIEMIWYVDSSNYITFGVYNNAFRIYEVVGGSGSTISTVALDSIERDDRMTLEIVKYGDVLRCALAVDGQSTKYIDDSTALTSEAGCLGFTSTGDYQYYFVTDFVVGSRETDLPNGFAEPTYLYSIKLEDESRASTTTPAVDSELKLKFPPNSVWEVKAFWLTYADSTTPDMKLDYDYDSGDHFKRWHDGRIVDCSATGTTAYQDVSVQRNTYAYSTAVTMGLVNSGETPMFETMIFKVYENGLTLTPTWSQNTSSTDEITMKKGSYLLAKRIG